MSMNFIFWIGTIAIEVYKAKTMSENKVKGGGEQNLTVSLIKPDIKFDRRSVGGSSAGL